MKIAIQQMVALLVAGIEHSADADSHVLDCNVVDHFNSRANEIAGDVAELFNSNPAIGVVLYPRGDSQDEWLVVGRPNADGNCRISIARDWMYAEDSASAAIDGTEYIMAVSRKKF